MNPTLFMLFHIPLLVMFFCWCLGFVSACLIPWIGKNVERFLSQLLEGEVL